VSAEVVTASTLPDLTGAREQLLLVLADEELVSGHRAAYWTGIAPSLEEDLAFSTIAQDELNHADVWFQVLLGEEVEDVRAAVDALAFGREPDGYRHAILCERPPRDFAYTLARHWCYDRFDAIRLTALAGSSDATIAAVAAKLRHEERYHLEHADHWFARLAGAGDEARSHLEAALRRVLGEAFGLFEPFPAEEAAVAAGLLPVPHAELCRRWCEVVAAMLGAVGLGGLAPAERDTPPAEALGGRDGRHTPDFVADVWPEMTGLYRAHPGARW
jgi:ring-1,2-phenylacetyl-CoA epoxidase subunit PaaC